MIIVTNYSSPSIGDIYVPLKTKEEIACTLLNLLYNIARRFSVVLMLIMDLMLCGTKFFLGNVKSKSILWLSKT